MIPDEDIERRFIYHPPREGQPEIYEAVRSQAKSYATWIVHHTPSSREQSHAITALEEAVFWANAAIARHA